MKEKVELILREAESEIEKVTKEADLLNVKSKLLGKSSKVNELMTDLKSMSIEEKKQYGRVINELKYDLEQMIQSKYNSLNTNEFLDFDHTLPSNQDHGSLHPVTIVSKEVTDILTKMGFIILNGPEMESEYYNFEALNIPKNHPARDMQDTFYLDNGLILRTHTSTNQVRGMEKYGAPIRLCAPGRCFRNENIDHSHDNTFFQLEGMVIDKNVSIGNLIYVMKELLDNVFKKDVKVRLRPGFFPFVEPGFELDCSCLICEGIGCPTCKGSGWIELCPCGMIHPNVLRMSGINPDEYNGFAFGMGLTRLAMMKYKIDDVRVLNSGDLMSLERFNLK